MTLKLDKRYSNGLTVLASYVLSKQFSDAENAAVAAGGVLDHYNKTLDKALAGNDQTHMFRFAYTYDLPFGKRKHFNLGPAGNALAGDWTASGQMNYESGVPMAVTGQLQPHRHRQPRLHHLLRQLARARQRRPNSIRTSMCG